MAKKNQPSSVDKLPPEVRDEVNRARQQFGWTIDQLVAYCSENGHHITRSAMGRYVRSLHLDVEDAAEEIARSNAISTALIERFGDKQDNELARLNMQLMHSQVFRMLMQERELYDEDGKPIPGDSLHLQRLSKTVQQLLSSEKMNVERIKELKRMGAEEERERMKAALDAQWTEIEADPKANEYTRQAMERARRAMGFD